MPNFIEDDNGLVHKERDVTTTKYYGEHKTEILIAKDNQGDYQSIGAALAAETNPNTIFKVYPGTYVEAPIILTEGSRLIAVGTPNNTIIAASNPNGTLITMAHNCGLKGFTLTGCSGITGRAIYYNGYGAPGKVTGIDLCVFVDNTIAVEAENESNIAGISNKLVLWNSLIHNTTAMQYGFKMQNKIDVTFTDVGVEGAPNALTINGIYLDNVSATIVNGRLKYCSNGLTVNGAAKILGTVLVFENNDKSIILSGSGGDITITDFVSYTATTYDIDITAPANSIDINIPSGTFDWEKVNNPNKNKITGNSFLNKNGKIFRTLTGNIRVGNHFIPSKLHVGEGASYFENMIVLSNSNLETGTWVDNTAAAKSMSGSTFSIFQGTAIGNCMYIGSDTNIYGIKIVPTSAEPTVVWSDVIWEYWNGTAWISFSTYSTNSSSPFYSKTAPFLAFVDKQHIRFGLTSNTNFALKTLNGFSAYWVRLRLVNTIASVPTAEQINLHGSSLEINKNGYKEYYGDARTIGQLALQSYTTDTVNSTTAQSMYLSKNLFFIGKYNKFTAGVLNRISYCAAFPKNVDTSFPLKLKLNFIGSSNTTGDVQWTVRWDKASLNANIYTTETAAPSTTANEKSMMKTYTMPANNMGKMKYIVFDLNIENFIPNPSTGEQTIIWFSLERNVDTYPGNVCLTHTYCMYVKSQSMMELFNY